MEVHQLLEQIETVLNPVLQKIGFELADLELVFEHGRSILRLYIDREEGVTVGDCATVSRAVEGVLDVENLIPHAYVLEVSSPGINRSLRKKRDFERFQGNWVELKTKDLVQGKRRFSGVLKGMHGEQVVILEGGIEWRIPLEQLKKAKLKRSIKV